MTSIARIGVVALVLLAAPWPAVAGGVRFELEFREGESGSRRERATLWLSDRRVRIEQQARVQSQGPNVIIYRGDEDVFLSLDPRRQRYLQIGRELIIGLGFEMLAARREVDGRLGRLPEDQHAILDRYLGSHESEKPLALSPVRLVPNRRSGRVGSYSCRGRNLVRGKQVVADVCVVDWRRVGIGPEDLQVFRELANFQRELMGARDLTPLEIVPNQPLDLLVQFDGFPLYFRNLDGDAVQSVIRVLRAEPIADAAGLFEVPPGYRLLSGFEFLAGEAALPARPQE